MLRKILIGLGLLVALLPYLGFPASINTAIFTITGLSIVFLLIFGRRGRMHYHDDGIPGVLAHTLHVERTEVEDRPLVHIEKKVVVDTEEMSESPDSVSVIEKQTTTTRRRRRDTDDRSASNGV